MPTAKYINNVTEKTQPHRQSIKQKHEKNIKGNCRMTKQA